MVKGVLCKQSQFGIETGLLLVVPKQRQAQVLRMAHEMLGHLGRDTTLSVAQEMYFWVSLTKSIAIDQQVRGCPR